MDNFDHVVDLEFDTTLTVWDNLDKWRKHLKNGGYVTIFVDPAIAEDVDESTKGWWLYRQFHIDKDMVRFGKRASISWEPGLVPMMCNDVRVNAQNQRFIELVGVTATHTCEPLVVARSKCDEMTFKLAQKTTWNQNSYRKTKSLAPELKKYAREIARLIQLQDVPRMAAIDKLSWAERIKLRDLQMSEAKPIQRRQYQKVKR